jgi:polyhydroxybutyrate depolymerase
LLNAADSTDRQADGRQTTGARRTIVGMTRSGSPARKLVFALIVAMLPVVGIAAVLIKRDAPESRDGVANGPCARPGAGGPQPGEQHLEHGGVERSYLLALPPSYDARSAHPLLVNFHGAGGSKEKTETNTSMGREGSSRGYIVVTPDAFGTARTWNWRGQRDERSDFEFAGALVDDLRRRLCIDPARMYLAGHSNGSAFAGLLACRQPAVFAAVAMVSATVPADCPPDAAPAVLAIHGTADPAVPFEGGRNELGRATPIPPATETIARYAARYGCAATPLQDEAAPGVRRTSYSGCRGGADVVLCAVVGGKHAWPGTPAAVDQDNSPAGQTFPATATILSFFDAHRLVGH